VPWRASYRGKSFGALFENVKAFSALPVAILEFGVDAYAGPLVL
jgi:hypothetical protein